MPETALAMLLRQPTDLFRIFALDHDPDDRFRARSTQHDPATAAKMPLGLDRRPCRTGSGRIQIKSASTS